MTSLWKWFAQEPLDWVHRNYIIDWAFVFAFWITAQLIFLIPIYERDIPLNDESISHKHTHEQISSGTNVFVALFIPLAVATVVGVAKRSVVHIHHSWLSALAGSGLTHLVTQFLKNRGDYDPIFSRGANGISIWKRAQATSALSSIRSGRKSFPSGHSSTAFAGMTFFALYLVSQSSGYTSSKLSRIFIVLLPLFYAAWVAISRVEDYRHHVEDVVAGGIIGIISSVVCFTTYWHNPFSKARPSPRSVYGEVDEGMGRPRREEYQLALENDV